MSERTEFEFDFLMRYDNETVNKGGIVRSDG